MNMYLEVLAGCYLTLIATALFNKDIINTQDIGDDQSWHKTQLIQWIIVYGFYAFVSKEWLIVAGFALTYPFLYDGLLNKFRALSWNYEGYEDYGKDFTLNNELKLLLFVTGLIILIIRMI